MLWRDVRSRWLGEHFAVSSMAASPLQFFELLRMIDGEEVEKIEKTVKRRIEAKPSLTPTVIVCRVPQSYAESRWQPSCKRCQGMNIS